MTPAAPGPAVRHTHAVSRDGDLITKTYRSWARSEPVREWTTLQHLRRHAPGLAPEPDTADLTGDPPWIRMRVVPGAPIRGRWNEAQLDALAVAMRRLWSVPVPSTLPPIDFHAPHYWRALAAASARPADPATRAVYDAARDWIAGTGLSALLGADVRPVLGQGDPQAGNLHDAGRIRLVDFEDTGPSDLAFELANFAEHLGAREAGLDRLAARFSGPSVHSGNHDHSVDLLPERDRRPDEVAEQTRRLAGLLAC